MNNERRYHTASVLIDGKVLVTGGEDGNWIIFNTAELYDPSTGNWTSTGSMNNVRLYHTTSVLTNGKVLVAGGENSSICLNTAELY
jgi:N-acetylneuraminic acid mutarotase